MMLFFSFKIWELKQKDYIFNKTNPKNGIISMLSIQFTQIENFEKI
jgi:hypothetical protein